MSDLPVSDLTPILYWILAALAALALIVVLYVLRKGRRLPGEHVFRASRLSRGNRLFPAQVVITPTSLSHFHPQWIGKLEESIHMAHVSSIKIDTHIMFSDVVIESTGGHNPIRVPRPHERRRGRNEEDDRAVSIGVLQKAQQ